MAKAGTFAKGFDSRRFIRANTGVWEFRQKLGELLREQSLDALNYLVATLNDKKAHPRLRKECAIEILNRGLGAPVSAIVIESLDNKGDGDVTKLSTPDLERIMAKLTANDKDVIEAEVVEVETNSPRIDAETATKNSLKQSGIS